MAGNVTDKNPMILDTEDATDPIYFSAFSNDTGNRMFVDRIVWRKPTTDNHLLTLKINGVDVTRNALANADMVVLDKAIEVSTMYVTDLDSGTVEVWLR